MEPSDELGLVDEADPAKRLERMRACVTGRALVVRGENDLDGVGGPFDTVVAYSALHRAAAPGRLIERLAGLLAEPDGEVWFLEPSAGPTARAGTLDIPAELRSSGLFVTDLDRFAAARHAGSRQWDLWVEGKARRSRRPGSV